VCRERLRLRYVISDILTKSLQEEREKNKLLFFYDKFSRCTLTKTILSHIQYRILVNP